MTSKRIVLVFHILTAALASGGRAEEGAGCLPAGAARCDPSGRHLSVCLGPAGWRTAVDCAKYGQRCADGRCRPTGPEEPSGRDDPCLIGDEGLKCNPNDCHELWYCDTTGDNLVSFCPESCHAGKCVGKDEGVCKEQNVYCFDEGVYPSLMDCTMYYDCRTSRYPRLVSAVLRKCDKSGQYYDACLNTCREFDCTSPRLVEGKLTPWPHNRILYYLYTPDGTVIWSKCSNGEFDGKKCTDTGYNCPGDSGGGHTTTSTTTTTTEKPQTNVCSGGKTGPVCNPKSNCNFYYCYSDGTYAVKHCKAGNHFVNTAQKCISGGCSDTVNGCTSS